MALTLVERFWDLGLGTPVSLVTCRPKLRLHPFMQRKQLFESPIPLLAVSRHHSFKIILLGVREEPSKAAALHGVFGANSRS